MTLFSIGKANSIKEEVHTVMRRGVTTIPKFHPSEASSRRTLGKGKRKTATTLVMPAKRTKNIICKNVTVFKYMGPNAPSEFARSDKFVIVTGMLEFDHSALEEEIREDLVDLIRASKSSGCDLSRCKAEDIEFVKCTGKVCRIPDTTSQFSWNGNAIKHLCGQGDLYVRLQNDVLQTNVLSKKVKVEDDVIIVGTSRSASNVSTSDPRGIERTHDTSTLESRPVDATECSPGTSNIDPQPSYHAEFEDNSKELGLDKLYELFPHMPKSNIDRIYELSCNSDVTLDALLDPTAEKLLGIIRDRFIRGEPVKCRIDEEDMFADCLAFYKRPDFDPCRPIRVVMKSQPAIDTGGVRRHFFSQILHKFAHEDPVSMFVGPPKRFRLDYSPLVLPVAKILGRIIAHSLLQEGPGFPYLAPYVYWYIVTGCEETALSYVTLLDLSRSVAEVVEQVCSLLCSKM